MIALSMSKCGEFCRNLMFCYAIRLRRHFHGSGAWGLSRLFEGFARWFRPVFACLGHVFQSFCFDAARQNKRTQSRPVTTITVQAQGIGPPCDHQTKWDPPSPRKKRPKTPSYGRAWQTVHPINKTVKTRARAAKFSGELG